MLKNEITTLRDIDVTETIQNLGLIQSENDANQYEGDNHRISVNNQKWYDHNNSKGGGGSIDLVSHVLICTFKDSLEFLCNGYTVTHINKTKKSDIKARSIVPIEYPKHWKKTREYLIKDRLLNPIIIDWCYEHQLIYADRFNNAVFKYGDGVEMRGIYKKWRSCRGIMSKPFMLRCNGLAYGLAITESAIDCLSYRQLHQSTICASIAGNGNKKLIVSLIQIAKRDSVPIISAFDNDKGGDMANAGLCAMCEDENVTVIQDRPSNNNDWNDELMLVTV